MSDDIKTEAEERLTREDFQRILKEMTRQGQNVAEYQGQLGQYIKNQIEHFGLNRAALTVVRRTDKMEPAKALETIRASIQYWYLNGDFDQLDAFDDLTILLRRILEANDRNRETRNVGEDETLSSLIH